MTDGFAVAVLGAGGTIAPAIVRDPERTTVLRAPYAAVAGNTEGGSSR